MRDLRIKNTFLAISIVSGIILYLELAFIRFLPAHILYLGFFSNFTLLASFLGIGLGFLMVRYPKKLFYFFPVTLLATTIIAKVFSTGINLVNNEVIFFKSDVDVQSIALPVILVLPVVFVTVAALFASISQLLGLLFVESGNSLKAYIYDLIGSLIGISVFYLISVSGLPPFIWFILVSVLFIGVVIYKKKYYGIVVILFLAALLLSIDTTEGMTFWSPYQKISVVQDGSNSYNLLTNNIHHQFFSSIDHALPYLQLYNRVSTVSPLNDVLIIGSGTGQDINAALNAGAKNIDAVEIDPKILAIGKELHPDQPYQNARVTAINTDGRNYIHNTTKKYDVIAFALTDSIILDSGFNQVRLESYLFTQESFADAKAHLKDGGVLIMYNDYRKEWLINRLGAMIQTVFGAPPTKISLGNSSRLFISPLNNSIVNETSIDPNLPTDNWPFLYLKNQSIPPYYSQIFMIILLISTCSIIACGIITKTFKKINISRMGIFFLLGAAFSLIETKSLAQLNLLFGATWIVNGIAFSGILLIVLCATVFTLRFSRIKMIPVLILFFISLFIQFIIPIEMFLKLDFTARLLFSTLYFFLPIFFANLIFARLFKESKSPDLDFGANILGLVFGGVTEYIALITGYKALVIVAALFYMSAMIMLFRFKKRIAR